MDLTNPQIIMRDKENARLKEDLAKEREKAETRKLALDAAVSSSCVLAAELAAAQAVIEQMREALTKIELGTEDAIPPYRCISKEHMSRIAHKALALPANLDALHEALALECERLAENRRRMHDTSTAILLDIEAAEHRERKQATKEVGHE